MGCWCVEVGGEHDRGGRLHGERDRAAREAPTGRCGKGGEGAGAATVGVSNRWPACMACTATGAVPAAPALVSLRRAHGRCAVPVAARVWYRRGGWQTPVRPRHARRPNSGARGARRPNGAARRKRRWHGVEAGPVGRGGGPPVRPVGARLRPTARRAHTTAPLTRQKVPPVWPTIQPRSSLTCFSAPPGRSKQKKDNAAQES